MKATNTNYKEHAQMDDSVQGILDKLYEELEVTGSHDHPLTEETGRIEYFL